MSGAAVVLGSDHPIGAALAAALIEEDSFARVHALPFVDVDPLDEAALSAAAAEIAKGPTPTLIIIASEHRDTADSLAVLDRDALARSFAANTIAPMLAAKHFLPLLASSGTPVFALLSGREGSIGDNRLGGAYATRTARAALTQFVKTLAIENSRAGKRAAIVALDPGHAATPERAALQLLDAIEGLGVRDSGKFLSWDGSEIVP